MRRTLVAVLGLIVGFLFLSLDISRHSSGDHAAWRISIASPAHAQFNCEYPPIDEPDGDSDECNPNYNPNPAKNQGDPCGNGCGNPINFATGEKYQAETDYASVGPFPLVLARYYNSLDTTGVHKFGAKQRGSYGRSIAATPTVATVTRDDGKVLTFTLTSSVWTPDLDVNYRLTKTGSGWTLVTDQDETETYDTNGRLLTYANRPGLTQTFSRDGQGRLVTATDPFGRTMTFAFASSSSSLITRVTAPDGGVYSYTYDGNSNLTSVTFPDSSQRHYVYENASYPTNVTGVIDENGNRYATFAYDVNGLAISTQHAGGADLNTVDYTYLTSLGVSSVTGPLDGVTGYLLESPNGTAKQAQVNRSCPICYYIGGSINNTFDTNGNLTSATDYDGNVTTYTYDTTRNLETSRTMAYGTLIARTITTTWNPNYRLPAQIVDGTRTITNSYDAKGNLLSSTLTAPTITSTRSFTFCIPSTTHSVFTHEIIMMRSIG
jgi:YD repeat-containing protein